MDSIRQLLEAALSHHYAGRLMEAEALYRQVLTSEPAQADALHLLGVIAHQQGRYEDAARLIAQAIAGDPDAAEFHLHLADAMAEMNRLEEAAASYRRALELQPERADAWNNLGLTLHRQGKLDEAAAAYQRALALAPKLAGARNNLGELLRAQGRLTEAIVQYEAALAADPALAAARRNLAVTLLDHAEAFSQQGWVDEAIGLCRRAIELWPGEPRGHVALGTALKRVGEVDAALESFGRALEISPGLAAVESAVLFAMQSRPRFGPREIYEAHLGWARRHAEGLRMAEYPHPDPLPKHREKGKEEKRRLRIGYVSADFRDHAVAFFFEPLLEAHDRESFEVLCYSNVKRPDEVTARLQRRSDLWRDIAMLSDDQVAAMIREDAIDILVDLSGHTPDNRLLVFARKPAPVQATYLGYPATTGMSAMDYRVTDALADPPGMEKADSEELVRLNPCAWCYRPPDEAMAIEPARAEPDGGITFGSFSVLSKFNEQVIALWAQIVTSTPGARLLIKSQYLERPALAGRMLEMLAQHGIGGERVELRGTSHTWEEHLRTYQHVDVVLDPFPYGGTTTICEALWMGTPVVTLAGDRHAGRVGVSLLNCIGMPELAAGSPDEYARIARQWAMDSDRLAAMRRELRARMQQSPLTDARLFARQMEQGFRTMWLTRRSR